MRQKALEGKTTTKGDEAWNGKEWTIEEIRAYAASNPTRCFIVIDDFVVDVTEYLGEHVSPSRRACACSGADVFWKAGRGKAAPELCHSR